MLKTSFMVFSILLCTHSTLSCKRKDTGMAFNGSTDGANGLQGKPDKTSEEPIGLPGYPLICMRESPATDGSITGTVDCFLGTSDGKAAVLNSKPVWKVTFEGAASVTSTVVDVMLRIFISAKNLTDFTLAMQGMQVGVAYNGAQGTFRGLDIFKARPGQWLVMTNCDTTFSMTLQDNVAPPMLLEIARFDGCEILGSVLINAIVPNPSFRGLPDVHKTVSASCSTTGVLTLTVPLIQGKNTLGPVDPQACSDLATLINAIGI